MTKEKYPTFCSSIKCQCLMFFLTAGCVAIVVCVALLSTAVRMRRPPDMEWWKTTIVYQIYPRSFMDSDGDGIGDLRGIIEKMDYFPYLNVKAIWISPVFESPMKDFGYDISNFTGIDPVFGDLDDMDDLIEQAHKKDVKVILDFVPNHSSGTHTWFQQSVANDSKYADYYIWSDGKMENGSRVPPNNWLSVFKDSAWEWSDARKQFYYHAYLKQQPDFNYRNKAVVEEMQNVLRFWLDRGVDGFRIDALAHLFEETDFSKDEPPSHLEGYDNTQWQSLKHIYTQNKKEDLKRILDGWRSVLDEYENDDGKPRFMVVEAYTKSIEERISWYDTGADMPFYFGLVRPLKPDCGGTCVSKLVNQGYEDLPKGAWPNFVLGNHDNRRVSTRKGEAYVDVLNMLLLTLWGTPTTYYGEEIGMLDVEPTYNQTVDPQGKHFKARVLSLYSPCASDRRLPELFPGSGTLTHAMERLLHGGFTNSSTSWLPIGVNYTTINVESEKNTSNFSTLKLYRTLAKLREEPAFSYGKINNVVVNDNIFSYLRHATDFTSYLVVLNLGYDTSTDDYSGKPVNVKTGKVVATTGNSGHGIGDTIDDLSKLQLDPAQGLVIEL